MPLEYGEAEEILREFIGNNPSNPFYGKALETLAECLFFQNKFHEAATTYSQLLQYPSLELEKKEEQLQQSKRLASMGKMAMKIAHEIRNPLGSIELFASFLRKELEKDEANRVLADYIISEVKSLNQVVCNMLLFTRSLRPNYQP